MINEIDVPLHSALASSNFGKSLTNGIVSDEYFEKYKRCVIDIQAFTNFNNSLGNPTISNELFINQIIEKYPEFIDWEIMSQGNFSIDFTCKHIKNINLVNKELKFEQNFVIKNWSYIKPYTHKLVWYSPNIFDDIFLEFLKYTDLNFLLSNIRFILASSRLSNLYISNNLNLFGRHEYLLLYQENLSIDNIDKMITNLIRNSIFKHTISHDIDMEYQTSEQRIITSAPFGTSRILFMRRNFSLINLWDCIHPNMTLCQSGINDPIWNIQMYTSSFYRNSWKTLCNNFHWDECDDVGIANDNLNDWIPYARANIPENDNKCSTVPIIDYKTFTNWMLYCINNKNKIMNIIFNEYMHTVIPDSLNIMDDTDKKYKLNQYQSQFYYEIQTGLFNRFYPNTENDNWNMGDDNDANSEHDLGWYGYDYLRAKIITARMIHLYRVALRTIIIIQQKFREYSYAPGGGMYKRAKKHWEQTMETNY